MNLSDLVTKPSGKILDVTPGTWQYTTADGQAPLIGEIAMIQWTNREYLSSENWDQPIGHLIDMGVFDSGYARYVSYVATVSYAGQERQYPAFFLFGSAPGNSSMVLPLDDVIGGLSAIMQAPVTPDPLKAPLFRGMTEATALINLMRAPDGCTPESRTQMCCDETTGMCGVSAETLKDHGLISSLGESPR